MKKYFILTAAAMLLAGMTAFAQMSAGAGYVNSSSTVRAGKNSSGSTSALNGFYAGASYTMPLSGGVNFTPGLYYELLADNNSGDVVGVAVTEHYLNIPLTFSYGISPAAGIRVFAFAGPTATFGLASTTDANAHVAGISVGGKIDNYDNDDYGRFNIMIGGGIGFEYSRVRLTLGYDYGLLNRYTGSSSEYTRIDSRLHVGLGFLF